MTTYDLRADSYERICYLHNVFIDNVLKYA